MKITPTQQDLLAKAAARSDGLITDPMTTSVRKALLARGLATAEDGALQITDAARATVLCTTEHQTAAETPRIRIEPPAGKLAVIADLLRRPGGASLVELQKATGWQPHSVRGALAGALKKRFQLNIQSQQTESGRSYTVATLQTAAPVPDERA